MQEEEQRLEAQQVLNTLSRERIILFPLTAHKIQASGFGEYLVSFHDSRIHSCRFSWKEGENFKEVFRAAIIVEAARVSGPLNRKASPW